MCTHTKALKKFLWWKWPSFLSSQKLAFNFNVINMCKGLVAILEDKLSFVSSLLGVRVVAGAAVVAVEEVNSSRLNPTLGQLSMSIPSYPQWSSTRNPWSSRDSTMQRKKTWPAKCRHFRRWLPTVRILKSGCSQHCRGEKRFCTGDILTLNLIAVLPLCTECGLLQLQNLQLLVTFGGRTYCFSSGHSVCFQISGRLSKKTRISDRMPPPTLFQSVVIQLSVPAVLASLDFLQARFHTWKPQRCNAK